MTNTRTALKWRTTFASSRSDDGDTGSLINAFGFRFSGLPFQAWNRTAWIAGSPSHGTTDLAPTFFGTTSPGGSREHDQPKGKCLAEGGVTSQRANPTQAPVQITKSTDRI